MSLTFVQSSFLGAGVQASRNAVLPQTSTRRSSFRPSAPSMSAKVLIINTKGGGHGHIGLHLAEKLLNDGNQVHIHQLGSETSSGPAGQYPTLASSFPDAFSVGYGDVPASIADSYDAIYDNNAKSLDDIAPAITSAKATSAQLFYISSAGAYNYDPNVAPHLVGDGAKGPTIDVENAIRDAGVSSVNFRPIYIIGPHTSKREYIDFFFDRIVRDRPIPIPGCGEELTSITDVRDVASMLAAAVGKPLKDETLNVTNTRALTLDTMAKICAQACGRDVKIIHYDPDAAAEKIDGFKVKKAFPFRPRHFFADPGESIEKLGWMPEVSGSAVGLAAAVKTCFEEYVALGLDKAVVDFSLDDKILSIVQ